MIELDVTINMSNRPLFVFLNVKTCHWDTSLPTQTSIILLDPGIEPKYYRKKCSKFPSLIGSDFQGNESHLSHLTVGLGCSQKLHKPPLERNMWMCLWELQFCANWVCLKQESMVQIQMTDLEQFLLTKTFGI